MVTFTITRFNSEVKTFLKGYMPKDKHFTSFDEIETIEEKLSLHGKTADEVHTIRNTVVLFYDNLRDNEFDNNGRSEIWYDYMTAMQSVTAAIDNYLYTKF